jgi:hypothetical protein
MGSCCFAPPGYPKMVAQPLFSCRRFVVPNAGAEWFLRAVSVFMDARVAARLVGIRSWCTHLARPGNRRERTWRMLAWRFAPHLALGRLQFCPYQLAYLLPSPLPDPVHPEEVVHTLVGPALQDPPRNHRPHPRQALQFRQGRRGDVGYADRSCRFRSSVTPVRGLRLGRLLYGSGRLGCLNSG